MKKLNLLIALCFFSQLIIAQKTGQIHYTETIKLNIQMDDMPGVDIKSMLPESTSFNRTLYFNEQGSLYGPGVAAEAIEDTEITSDDGSFKMVFKVGDDIEELLYTDYSTKEIVHQQGFMGKTFIINKEIPAHKWKMTGEKIKYLDYECMKATCTYDDQIIVAWFTSQLPAKVGPAEFGQLPGAVLMVSIDGDETEIKATEVSLGPIEKKIEAPKGGKNVTAEEYEKIQEEKMKELEENSGEGTIRIRG